MAEYDELTGLLSMKGYLNAVRKYLTLSPERQHVLIFSTSVPSVITIINMDSMRETIFFCSLRRNSGRLSPTIISPASQRISSPC